MKERKTLEDYFNLYSLHDSRILKINDNRKEIIFSLNSSASFENIKSIKFKYYQNNIKALFCNFDIIKEKYVFWNCDEFLRNSNNEKFNKLIIHCYYCNCDSLCNEIKI